MAEAMMMDHDLDLTTLTDKQETLLSILGIISGTMSILGSACIVSHMWRYHRIQESTTTYERLMAGLSIFDMSSSFAFGFAPFFLPRDTSPRSWASGNDRTCTMIGFFTQIGFGAIWYNGLLSIYYVMTIRFRIEPKVFAEKYEKWLHLTTWLYFLGTAIGGLVIDLYGETEIAQMCWISEYPPNCEEQGNCISTLIGWAYGGLPFVLVYLGLPINNLIIYLYVRRQFGTKDVKDSSGRHILTSSQYAQKMRVREVAQQGFMYVAFFYIAFTPAFIIRVLEGLGMDGEKEADIYWLLVMNAALLPLQGWFNFFIYIRPSYLRVRKAFPDRSAWWAIKQCVIETDLPSIKQMKELYSAHMINLCLAEADLSTLQET